MFRYIDSEKEYGAVDLRSGHRFLQIRSTPERKYIAWTLGELIPVGVDVRVEVVQNMKVAFAIVAPDGYMNRS